MYEHLPLDYRYKVRFQTNATASLQLHLQSYIHTYTHKLQLKALTVVHCKLH